MSAIITIARHGGCHGVIVATLPGAAEYHFGARLVVGDVRRISGDGEPEFWRAWLWPEAGGALRMGRSCDVVDAGSPDKLLVRLRKRAGTKGPWWTVPDGRCTEVLEHGGRRSRCETAAVVAHDAHRNHADGVQWKTGQHCRRSLDEEGTASW